MSGVSNHIYRGNGTKGFGEGLYSAYWECVMLFCDCQQSVRLIESYVNRYQDQGEKLQVDNLRLHQDLENSKLNLKDINEFLTNELKARALSSAALEHRKRELEQELADQKAQYEVWSSALFST